MNTTIFEDFITESEKKAFDIEHRRKINFNIGKYDLSVPKGKSQFSNLELARQRAAALKYKITEKLDKYLIEFESNFIKNGGKVIWAEDAKEAIKEILNIAHKYKTQKVVKAKSMVTEEIHLNQALEEKNITSLETDLGEYIVQLAGETPYHIITPAMHKSKEDIARLFSEKKGLTPESSPEEITTYVRNILRQEFTSAEMGISGANFLIADSGSVALTENEGNIVMSMSFPKVHIAIAGIEKLIPSLTDLDLFWPLLATHGTGQQLTAYNSIVSGPRQTEETDGPHEMYLVLLDNGRSKLLAETEQRRALSCIRCGACLNGCPVYKNIGGHSYGTTYSGPIGSVITPHLRGMKQYKHLSYASSLCGKCTEVCPVKIDLHKLLLYNRRDAINQGLNPRIEKFSMFIFKKMMLNRAALDKASPKFKNFGLKTFFKKAWGDRRAIPNISPKSFNRLWREQKGM
jgi:L-lactate dehydrogenase complex protein LldF